MVVCSVSPRLEKKKNKSFLILTIKKLFRFVFHFEGFEVSESAILESTSTVHVVVYFFFSCLLR